MSDCGEEAQDWRLYVEDVIEFGGRVFAATPTPPLRQPPLPPTR